MSHIDQAHRRFDERPHLGFDYEGGEYEGSQGQWKFTVRKLVLNRYFDATLGKTVKVESPRIREVLVKGIVVGHIAADEFDGWWEATQDGKYIGQFASQQEAAEELNQRMYAKRFDK